MGGEVHVRTLVLVLMLVLSGCGGKSNSGEYCVPGQVQVCDLPGCATGGLQTCTADWAFGPCECVSQEDGGYQADGGATDAAQRDAAQSDGAPGDAAGDAGQQDAGQQDGAQHDGAPPDGAQHDGQRDGAQQDAAQADAAQSDAAQSDAAQSDAAQSDGGVDPCAAMSNAPSHLGCEHWATLTMNSQVAQGPGFNFAVAVVNPGPLAATVTVTGGALTAPLGQVVAGGTAATIKLPWVDALGDLGATGLSALAPNGGYKVTSTAPVAVYQYNVLEVRGSNGTACSTEWECGFLSGIPCEGGFCIDTSGTNGASLVLPARALGRDYHVVTRPTYGTTTCSYNGSNYQYSTVWYPGYFAVVASRPGTTTVTVSFAGHAGSGTGVPTAYNKGQTGTFTLSQGDVLQIASRGPTSCTDSCEGTCTTTTSQTCYCNSADYDLTGTRVQATQEVAVFAGHEFTQVPFNNGYGEHFEEQVWPVAAWGKRAIAVATQDPGARANVYRIISGADGNSLSFTPAVTGGVVLNRGQWREFTTSSSFEVNGSGRFLLAQLIQGRQAGGDSATGDPALSFVAPVEQLRSEYRVYVPAEYVSSAAVVAPTGASVLLDGVALGGFAPVGSGAYSGATITSLTAGFHTLTSASGFGVQLYGSADRTSYSYPAGLNLTPQP
jgi:hypothetical protein